MSEQLDKAIAELEADAVFDTAMLTARVNTSKSGSSTARKRLADGAKAELSAEELAALWLS